jgi:hypothetical protein
MPTPYITGPLRRARLRRRQGHKPPCAWKRPARFAPPPPPPILATITLSRAFTIDGVPFGPGVVHVKPDQAPDLLAMDSQARLNDQVWVPRRMPPQPS